MTPSTKTNCQHSAGFSHSFENDAIVPFFSNPIFGWQRTIYVQEIHYGGRESGTRYKQWKNGVHDNKSPKQRILTRTIYEC